MLTGWFGAGKAEAPKAAHENAQLVNVPRDRARYGESQRPTIQSYPGRRAGSPLRAHERVWLVTEDENDELNFQQYLTPSPLATPSPFAGAYAGQFNSRSDRTSHSWCFIATAITARGRAGAL